MAAIQDVVIVAAKRSAIGKFSGTLAPLPASELGAQVIRSLLDETKLDPNTINEVIMGQILTAACGQNPARQASLHAGLANETPAWTLNQVCGSGLRAVALAAQSIQAGDNQVVIAGGQESMSNAPHALQLRTPTRMGNAEMIDTMVHDGLWDIFNHYHMGQTAENLVEKYKITREEQDQFALASQQKTASAQQSGAFAKEITPITIKTRKEEIIFDSDEFPFAGASLEKLGALKPAFKKDGTVTAGNASGINDGAAAVLVMSTKEAEQRGLRPLVRIVSSAHAGVEPEIMGIGPVQAVQKALKSANWSIDDLDLIESNEAFAAQSIAVNKELKWNTDIINIRGGAIALGHPIGASGCRILVTLIHSMIAEKKQKGLATLCVGGGMGVALCVELVS